MARTTWFENRPRGFVNEADIYGVAPSDLERFQKQYPAAFRITYKQAERRIRQGSIDRKLGLSSYVGIVTVDGIGYEDLRYQMRLAPTATREQLDANEQAEAANRQIDADLAAYFEGE